MRRARCAPADRRRLRSRRVWVDRSAAGAHVRHGDWRPVGARRLADGARLGHRRLPLLGVGGSTAIGLAVAIVGFLLATPMLVFLFGASYAAATFPFQILCVGLPVVFAIWILHAIAISVDRERLLLKTGLVGLSVNVGLNLYVIPRYGGTGAALATVVGELVSVGMLGAGLRALWAREPTNQSAAAPPPRKLS
jgi:Na+-driven multidrug efflux pump